jgi:hypothetical protein
VSTTVRTRAIVVTALGLAAAAWTAAAAQTPAKPANVAGKWTITLQTESFTATPALELKQDGEKITGTYTGRYGAFPLEGKVKGNAIEFTFKMNAEGTDVLMSYKGEVASDGQSMKGQAVLSEMGEATWTAKKEK